MWERTRQGAVTVITGQGPLNREGRDEAERALRMCLADGQPLAVLDMEEIPLVDSVGLELLMDVQEEFVRRGGTLKLARANPLCRDVLHATRTDEFFELHDVVIEAVGSFLR